MALRMQRARQGTQGKKRYDLTAAERARRYRMRKAGANIPKRKPGPKRKNR